MLINPDMDLPPHQVVVKADLLDDVYTGEPYYGFLYEVAMEQVSPTLRQEPKIVCEELVNPDSSCYGTSVPEAYLGIVREMQPVMFDEIYGEVSSIRDEGKVPVILIGEVHRLMSQNSMLTNILVRSRNFDIGIVEEQLNWVSLEEVEGGVVSLNWEGPISEGVRGEGPSRIINGVWIDGNVTGVITHPEKPLDILHAMESYAEKDLIIVNFGGSHIPPDVTNYDDSLNSWYRANQCVMLRRIEEVLPLLGDKYGYITIKDVSFDLMRTDIRNLFNFLVNTENINLEDVSTVLDRYQGLITQILIGTEDIGELDGYYWLPSEDMYVYNYTIQSELRDLEREFLVLREAYEEFREIRKSYGAFDDKEYRILGVSESPENPDTYEVTFGEIEYLLAESNPITKGPFRIVGQRYSISVKL